MLERHHVGHYYFQTLCHWKVGVWEKHCLFLKSAPEDLDSLKRRGELPINISKTGLKQWKQPTQDNTGQLDYPHEDTDAEEKEKGKRGEERAQTHPF